MILIIEELCYSCEGAYHSYFQQGAAKEAVAPPTDNDIAEAPGMKTLRALIKCGLSIITLPHLKRAKQKYFNTTEFEPHVGHRN